MNFEDLVLALLVIADVLVLVMAFVLGKQRPGMKTKSLRTETKKFEIQDGEEAYSMVRLNSEKLNFFP